MSFIVQLPLTSSSRMATVRQVLREQSCDLHVIPFDDRPGKLFDGLQHCRSVIFLSEAPGRTETQLLTTRYQRWPTETRPLLFAQFEYAHASKAVPYPDLFPKYATDIEVSAFMKILEKAETNIGRIAVQRRTEFFVFYQEATQYWVKATIGLPYYAKDGVVGVPAHGRYIYFDNSEYVAAACAILNSSLFYVYFIAYGDCFHLSDALATGFPVSNRVIQNAGLADLGRGLQASLTRNAIRKTIQTKDGSEIAYAEFYASKSKPIIDEIDRLLADQYGFTVEERDFIMNYDVKFRMGIEG